MTAGDDHGVIAPDGCAVDLYALLPAGRDPQIVHAAVPDKASILELGCGAGRVTHRLIGLGHQVTAVDECAEMLAHVRGARTVLSKIEDFDLGQRFDVVLLASHLVNVPDDGVLQALLDCCTRHVASDGRVLIERHPVAWFDGAVASEHTVDGVVFALRDVSRPAADLLSAVVDYQVGERSWSHAFTARRLDDGRLGRALRDAGLCFDSQLTDDGSWVLARPA